MFGFGSDLGSSIAQGANLETMKYQQQSVLPNQHDNDEQLFSGLSKAFSAPGDRPRGFWRNLGAGAMEGLEYGARSNSIAERKENYGKYADEMNWFQQVNNALIDRNERAAEAEEEMTQIRPYATAGLEIAYSGMPYEQANNNMRALVEQLKINNPKFKGDYVGYVPNSPIVNIRDENGNINAVSLSSIVGEDITKRVQENYINNQKLAIEEKYAPEKYAVQREKLEETKRRNDAAALKHDRELSKEIGKKIDASREFLEIVPKMELILKDHSDIFQSAIDAAWREAKEPGYIENIKKDLMNKWNPAKVEALTSMAKYVNKMTLDVANGFSRPNMFIEKLGSKAVPNLDMSPRGFAKILGEMKEEYTTSLRNNLRRMEILESDLGTGIADQYKSENTHITNPTSLASLGRKVN